MSILIRRGSREDFGIVQNIERDSERLFLSVGYDFCCQGNVRDDDELARGIDHGALLIAEAENVPVGFALLWDVDGHGHLTELGVRLDFQKRGIGRMLMEHSEKWALDRGFSQITLTTFCDVPWNEEFYRRHGYRTFEVGDKDVDMKAIIQEEKEFGLWVKPRVVMYKPL